MKRAYVLGAVVAVGVAVAAAGLSAAAGRRPGPRADRVAAADGGGGRVAAIAKVADNLYQVPGAGGTTGVYVAANGVVLVDTKLANNGQAILDQVKSVTDKPITHIINTHTHGDHNGSNQFFPATVEIVTQENTSANMQKMPVFQEAANKHGLPDRTYKDKLTLLSGNDAIDLYYFGPAHTNGDTFVVFRNARVMHSGDAFANKGAAAHRREQRRQRHRLSATRSPRRPSTIKNVDTVITGHAAPGDAHDLAGLRRLRRVQPAVPEHARESLKAGKTPEQAMMDLKLPEKFKGYNLTGGRGGPGGNFGIIYEQLKAAN